MEAETNNTAPETTTEVNAPVVVPDNPAPKLDGAVRQALDMIASLLISLLGMVYPIVTNKMLNEYIPNKMYTTIVIAGLVVLALYVMRMLLRYFVQYYGHLIGVKMQARMRRDLFDRLQKLPFSFFDEHKTGTVMSRIINDLMDVSELAHHGPENLIVCTITIIGALLLGINRTTSAEFTFFLAIPTMVGTSAYKILKFINVTNH